MNNYLFEDQAMWIKRDIILFLAGAQTFHTLSHILLAFSGSLPIRFFNFWWTKQLNILGIIINMAVTAALFYWLSII